MTTLSLRAGKLLPTVAAASLYALMRSQAAASSHREAPFIAMNPTVDATDLYMFRSYESGRSGFVTIPAGHRAS